MPVGELLARTQSRELAEWRAYESEYGPLGPERGDWQAANIAYTVAVMAAGKKGKRLKVTDFVLKWAPKRRKSAEEMLNVFRALQAKQQAAAAARDAKQPK